MPLPTQLLKIPIVGGQAQQIDARVIEGGSWLTLQNYTYDKTGALRKRSGYGAMPAVTFDGGNLPGINKLDTTAAGELLAIGTDPGEDDGMPRVYSWSPTMAKWASKDNACPASLTRRAAVRSHETITGGCVAVCDGKQFVTYAIGGGGGGGIVLRITELSTGAVLYDDAPIAVGTLAGHALLTIGNTVLFVVADANKIIGIKINGSTLAQVGPTIVLTSPAGGDIDQWDACVIDDDTWGLVFTAVGHITAANVHIIDLATMASVDTTSIAGTSIYRVSVSSYSARLAVAWAHDDGADYSIKAQVFSSSDLSGIAGPLTVASSYDSVSNVTLHVSATGNTYVAWDGEEPTGADGVFARGIDASWALLGAATRKLWHTAIWSHPWSCDGQTYLLVANALTGAPPHPQGGVLVCLSDATTATAPLTTCGIWGASDSFASNYPVKPTVTLLSTDGGSRFLAPTMVYIDKSRAGLDVLAIDFRPLQPSLWASTQAQGLLLQTGGITGVWDGQCLVESGFMHAPEITAPSQTTGQVSGLGAGDYIYVAVYAWRDAKGNVHLSAPSAPVTVTVAPGDIYVHQSLTISTIAATRRGDDNDGAGRSVEILLYRTEANGSTLWRANVAARENDRASFSVTVTDASNDVTMLASTEAIYTNGGILEAQCPPPSVALCSHKGRIWLASAEDERSVWFSQLMVQGEAPRFNAELSLRLDDSPDGITALAPLDDKLIVFTPTRIYYVQGDGPADTGEAGSFGGPYLLTSTAGCVDARSVVVFEGGVMFQSAAGFYLLGRNLQLAYVGGPVEDTLDAYPTVRAATLDAARSRIVYLVADETGAHDPVSTFLVFDFLHGGAWLTWRIAGTDEQWSAAIWRGAHVYSAGEGVCLEAYGDYPGYDPGINYPVGILETPWVNVAGMEGYQRTRHVIVSGMREGYHTATVELMNDYSETVVQTRVFDATATSPLTGLPLERLDTHVAKQKASAIKIRITDTYDGGAVDSARMGLSIAAITLEVGAKAGRAKLPGTNRK